MAICTEKSFMWSDLDSGFDPIVLEQSELADCCQSAEGKIWYSIDQTITTIVT